MTVFGIDVSHHQGGSLDFQSLRDAGIEFAFVKATEGAGFIDSRFHTNLRRARDAGMLVAAYHYVRDSTAVASQVANVRRVVPTDVPVIPDVEDGSGTLPRVRTLVGLLRDAGYVVPLLYLPRWYWQRVGSPDLRGLPPLWSSRYPDNVVDDLRDEFARVPSHYWTGYGGLDVAVLQFTSSARIAGVAPLDANAFRGTRGQLAELLGRSEDDMFTDADRTDLRVAAWRLVTLLNLEDRVPTHDGVPPEVRDEPIALVAAFRQLLTDVAELKTRPVADVDEEALAAELAERGVVGDVRDQVIEAVRTVFADAGSGVE